MKTIAKSLRRLFLDPATTTVTESKILSLEASGTLTPTEVAYILTGVEPEGDSSERPR